MLVLLIVIESISGNVHAHDDEYDDMKSASSAVRFFMLKVEHEHKH
jgi:hypothetical protein